MVEAAMEKLGLMQSGATEAIKLISSAAQGTLLGIGTLRKQHKCEGCLSILLDQTCTRN